MRRFLPILLLFTGSMLAGASINQQITETEKELLDLRKKQNQQQKIKASLGWPPAAGNSSTYLVAVYAEANQATFEKYLSAYGRAEKAKGDFDSEIQKLEGQKKEILAGNVESRSINLKWSKDPVAVSYEVRLFDSSKTKIEEKKVEVNTIRFELKPGDYFFAVAGVSKFNVRGEFSDLIPVKVELNNSAMLKDLDEQVAEVKKKRQRQVDLQKDIDDQVKTLSVVFLQANKNEAIVELLPGQYRYSTRAIGALWSDGKAFKVTGSERNYSSQIEKLEERLIDLKVKRELADQKPPSGQNVAGVGFDYVMVDQEINRFNHFFGGSIFFRNQSLFNQSLFNQYINPELLFSYHQASGKEAPFNSLTMVRVYGSLFYPYTLAFISNRLQVIGALGGGMTIFSLFSNSLSDFYVTSGLIAGIEFNFEIIPYLQVYLRFNTNYVFDRTANLLFLNPAVGVAYRF